MKGYFSTVFYALSAIVMTALPHSGFGQVTNKWANNTANTPDTAHDWAVGSNWTGGEAPTDGSFVSFYPALSV